MVLLQKSKRFHVSIIDKYVKGGILKIVIDRNTQEVFNGVIYDAKFVELLMVGVIGKKQLVENTFNKKDMRFIQGNKFGIFIDLCRTLLNAHFFRYFCSTSQKSIIPGRSIWCLCGKQNQT